MVAQADNFADHNIDLEGVRNVNEMSLHSSLVEKTFRTDPLREFALLE